MNTRRVPMPRRPSALGNRVGSQPIRVKAVFLVGFMGAGKTTVGRSMAEQLGWEFTDLDERIEHRQRRSIASIIRTSGEQNFRKLENAELRRLISETRSGAKMVVALGGGTIAHPPNLSLVLRHTDRVVFLHVPVEILRRRCLKQARQRGPQRPLLGTMAEFRARYAARRPFYLQAPIRLNASGRRFSTVASEICDAFGLGRLRRG